jgi:hypothetical protein
MPDIVALALKFAPKGIALFNAAIFLDSLRYKFTDHPKTQEIFGRLDGWAGSLGVPGLFGQAGVFGQYVIGSAELAASVLLLVGAFYPPYRFLLPLGALLGLAVMTGAISFHLFTPLGIDPNGEPGLAAEPHTSVPARRRPRPAWPPRWRVSGAGLRASHESHRSIVRLPD